ncbi:SAM-dependent methyltransferase [Streptomyces sp. RFCAC02]|uniref:SAM-dependent methyltransferase n=1 Tax=Streptomyces sp. RFCAC02 TaxID=2499143 RepID=UPI0010229E7E|nr:SAM-dependent methyltransferase [Streptomyces sp. RFCAC02]
MEGPTGSPPGIDLSLPSVSRMHDFYLGGSHNFEADRAAARHAMAAFPALPKLAQANRAFMRRAVRYALAEGVTQFLDIGSGITAHGTVHEAARATCPDARVLYVDHDPVAVAHSRELVADDDRTAVIAADIRDPGAILASPEARRLIHPDRPTALLLVGLLHFLPDTDRPGEKVAELRDALAPGSLLVLSHATTEAGHATHEEGARLSEVYGRGGMSFVLRGRRATARFFDGFELVEPGLVPPPAWRPDGPADEDDLIVCAGFAGVGRKA